MKFISKFENCSEIDDINEIEPQKEYVQRYQLVPVSEPSFNQEIYEQHGARGRSASDDSPESGNISIQNPHNGAIYVTSQHPNATDDVNGLRYAAGTDVRFDDETYNTRYEYSHGQHQSNAHNAHNAHSVTGEDIKIELIRNQHALHGKVSTHGCFYDLVETKEKRNDNLKKLFQKIEIK